MYFQDAEATLALPNVIIPASHPSPSLLGVQIIQRVCWHFPAHLLQTFAETAMSASPLSPECVWGVLGSGAVELCMNSLRFMRDSERSASNAYSQMADPH